MSTPNLVTVDDTAYWAPLGTAPPRVDFPPLTDAAKPPSPLRPITIDFAVNFPQFVTAVDQARLQLALFGQTWIHWLHHTPERPVDRARRLRLDRIARARTRRAARRQRQAAR